MSTSRGAARRWHERCNRLGRSECIFAKSGLSRERACRRRARARRAPAAERVMTSFLHDLRYAARTLRRSPLFTLVAMLTLAICSGADTAIFSVVDGVLLKPLPYPKANELVAIWQSAPGAQFNGGRLPTSASCS